MRSQNCDDTCSRDRVSSGRSFTSHNAKRLVTSGFNRWSIRPRELNWSLFNWGGFFDLGLSWSCGFDFEDSRI
jgi:hypothetical protein